MVELDEDALLAYTAGCAAPAPSTSRTIGVPLAPEWLSPAAVGSRDASTPRWALVVRPRGIVAETVPAGRWDDAA